MFLSAHDIQDLQEHQHEHQVANGLVVGEAGCSITFDDFVPKLRAQRRKVTVLNKCSDQQAPRFDVGSSAQVSPYISHWSR